MRITPHLSLVSALFLAPAGAAQNLLANPGFESSTPGVPPTGWSSFGSGGPPTNVLAELFDPGANIVPRTGGFLTKMYGQFNGTFNVSGMYQNFFANPGEVWTMDCWSRNPSNDPIVGGGAPGSNWMIMKLAFWDTNRQEIAGFEETILDGTSPTDTWIDNTPVVGIAPPGTVRVEAFIMFLQPGSDGGSGQVDDVELYVGQPPAATYPGSGADLVLSSAIGGATPTSGGGNDVKMVPFGGGLLELNISSPGGTFDLRPYLVLGQLFQTGAAPVPFPLFPNLYFDWTLPVILLQTPAGGPIGGQVIAPNGGTSLFYNVPGTLSGQSLSLMVQALWVDTSVTVLSYDASDAHELQFQ